MKRTAAINVSSTHGSCRMPVCTQRRSYISYGSRPASWAGASKPSSRRSLAISRPMFGMSSSLLTSLAVSILVFILQPPQATFKLSLLALHQAEAVFHGLARLIDERFVQHRYLVHAVEAEVAEVLPHLTPGRQRPGPAPERQRQRPDR